MHMHGTKHQFLNQRIDTDMHPIIIKLKLYHPNIYKKIEN